MKFRILIFFIFLFSGQAIAQKDSMKGNEPVRYYFPNGTLSSEGFIKNGKPDGYWKNYNEDGSLKSEGNRIDGELDSLWIFYGLKSIPKSSIQFKGGKKQGPKKQFDEKGILVSEESFELDNKQGWSFQYFPNGKTKYQVNFNNGKEEGRGLEFSEEGQIISLFDYKTGALMRQQRINRFDKLNRKTGYWIELYPDYSIKQETQFENGLKNGYLKEYDLKGNLRKIEKYIDDVLQKDAVEISRVEVRKQYFSNGKVSKLGSYNKDEPQGMHISFDSTGKPQTADLFENGVLSASGRLDEQRMKQGPWKEFYFNGELRAEGEYENDSKVGNWTYYFMGGKLEQKGAYSKGKPTGKWKWYYENGALLREETFLTGKEDGMSNEFLENGDTLTRGEYIDGEREGAWFFRDGDQSVFGNFISGKMHGDWVHLFQNGNKSFEGTFRDGVPEGKHRAWYEDGNLKWEGKYENGKRQGNWTKYLPDGLPFITIYYDQGIEKNYDGVKVFPEFDPTDYENLLQSNPYIF